jgi:hypothetical protein
MAEISDAETYDAAAELIADTGLAKGSYEEWDETLSPRRFCTMGAMLHVLGLDYMREGEPPVPVDYLGFSSWGAVADWNDAPERTEAEVVAKLRKAAALARAQSPAPLQQGVSR